MCFFLREFLFDGVSSNYLICRIVKSRYVHGEYLADNVINFVTGARDITDVFVASARLIIVACSKTLSLWARSFTFSSIIFIAVCYC